MESFWPGHYPLPFKSQPPPGSPQGMLHSLSMSSPNCQQASAGSVMSSWQQECLEDRTLFELTCVYRMGTQ